MASEPAVCSGCGALLPMQPPSPRPATTSTILIVPRRPGRGISRHVTRGLCAQPVAVFGRSDLPSCREPAVNRPGPNDGRVPLVSPPGWRIGTCQCSEDHQPIRTRRSPTAFMNTRFFRRRARRFPFDVEPINGSCRWPDQLPPKMNTVENIPARTSPPREAEQRHVRETCRTAAGPMEMMPVPRVDFLSRILR